jgi:hypothetical protein
MWYYLRGILIFYYLGFSINKMLCLLFPKKKTRTLRYNNSSVLKEFRIFLTGSSCELPLEAEQLDGLWFATTQPWSKYSKSKRTSDFQVIFA